MAESHVISGLVSKHSELAGEIDYHQSRVKQIRADVEAVATAIKVFDPDYDLRTIKAKPVRAKNQFFKHSESNRLLLDVIREAKGDISTPEIVEGVAKIKGIDLDIIDRKAFTASLFTVLKRIQNKNVIEEADRVDGVIVWRMTGD